MEESEEFSKCKLKDDTFSYDPSGNSKFSFSELRNNTSYSISLTTENENNNKLPFFYVYVEGGKDVLRL